MRGTCGLCRRGIGRAISGANGVVQSPRCLRVNGVWKLVGSVWKGAQIGSNYEKKGQICRYYTSSSQQEKKLSHNRMF